MTDKRKKIKIGYQSIIWRSVNNNLPYALDTIAGAGYIGVEFAQRPDELGDIGQLIEMCRQRNLTILGFAGGSLVDRVNFCRDFKPLYLYIKDWDDQNATYAIEKGFTLALHPHVYMHIHRLADALKLLEIHPEIKFLPDTAHLTIVGDDPVEAIRMTKDKIICVHLKDWTSKYGRSPFRYARGFTELGKGVVKLDDVLEELEKIEYSGWIVIEQDKTDSYPEKSIIECSGWLEKKGYNIKCNLVKNNGRRMNNYNSANAIKLKSINSTALRDQYFGNINSLFYQKFINIGHFFNTLLPCLPAIFKPNICAVWACSPANNLLSLLAESIPEIIQEPITSTIFVNKTFTGLAMEKQSVTIFYDLQKELDGRRFGQPDILKYIEKPIMISIPILNPDNYDHVQFMINIIGEIGAEASHIDKDLFASLAWYIAAAAQKVIEELCSDAVSSINYIAAHENDVKSFLKCIITIIQEKLNAEGVSIWLVNERGDKLAVAAATKIIWKVNEEQQFYAEGEGLTGTAWKKKETILASDRWNYPGYIGKSMEECATDDEHSLIIHPWFDIKGGVIGIIRCRNKNLDYMVGKYNVFSEIDIAILDSICSAASPHLILLLEKERRLKGLSKLTHELKVPLVAIRGATQMMIKETRARSYKYEYDYFKDIWSWSELMGRLLSGSDILAAIFSNMTLNQSSAFIFKDIMAPAIRQVQLLLEERDFSNDNIKVNNYEKIPRLWLDINYFQQVIFNLLSNAIKFAYKDQEIFTIAIDCDDDGDKYVIKFRDWGKGIQNDVKEMIFMEGYRGAGATDDNVIGQGFGLWIAREIIRAHGGCIEVTNLKFPTEFSIYLPYDLKEIPKTK